MSAIFVSIKLFEKIIVFIAFRYNMAQRKFSGDKRKSWPNEIKNTFHQRLLLEML